MAINQETVKVDYVQALNQANRKRDTLQNDITRLQLMLEQNDKARADLNEICVKKYGTADVAVLREMVQEMKSGDASRVTEYLNSLESAAQTVESIKRALEG